MIEYLGCLSPIDRPVVRLRNDSAPIQKGGRDYVCLGWIDHGKRLAVRYDLATDSLKLGEEPASVERL